LNNFHLSSEIKKLKNAIKKKENKNKKKN